MPRISKATNAGGSGHKLNFKFEGHPETRFKGREYAVPAECPRGEIFALGKRLAACAADSRGGRIYTHFLRKKGLFGTAWIGEYSRSDLLVLQTFANSKFTAKGAPTRAYMRELVYIDKFEWDNAKWDAKWEAMTSEERREHLGV